MRALVAWRGGLFLTEGKIAVLSVSSLFLTRVGVYVCVSVCIRTHTHTLHRCSDVSQGVGTRHLEGPKNKYVEEKKQLVQDLIPPLNIHIHMCTLYTYTNICMSRFSPSGRCERKPPIISNLTS